MMRDLFFLLIKHFVVINIVNIFTPQINCFFTYHE